MVDKLQPPRSRSFDFGQTRDFGPEVDETDAFFVESHDCVFLGGGMVVWGAECHVWCVERRLRKGL